LLLCLGWSERVGAGMGKLLDWYPIVRNEIRDGIIKITKGNGVKKRDPRNKDNELLWVIYTGILSKAD